MRAYHRLFIDINSEPWGIEATSALVDALLANAWSGGTPSGGRGDPSRMPRPLELHLRGKTPASLLAGGAGVPPYLLDIVASPPLVEVFGRFRLPAHVTIDCSATAWPPLRSRKRQPTGPHQFRWFWWTESFEKRIDPARSRFAVFHSDHTWVEASYESLDALERVEARRFLPFRSGEVRVEAVYPLQIAWADPVIEELDLIPYETGGPYLSERMARAVEEARLPGIVVLPPRSYTGSTWGPGVAW